MRGGVVRRTVLVLGLLALGARGAAEDWDARVVLLERRGRFAEALPLADEPTARELRARSERFEAALAQAQQLAEPGARALALGEALALAPESERVRDALASLPEAPDPWPLTRETDRTGKPMLVYAAGDAAVLALVPEGECKIGWASAEALPEEQPERTIVVGAFYIDRYEVSNRRYARFVAATRHVPPPHWRGKAEPPHELLDHPVVWVSYDDALAYALWARHRLPTELEWEKAARGADGRTFPWGEAPPDERLAEINRLYAAETAPVASHPLGASPFGCLDMCGNAAEWTSDTYAPYRYATLVDARAAAVPPPGALFKVVRGGAFIDIAELGRATFRSFQKPEVKAALYGFRVARDP